MWVTRLTASASTGHKPLHVCGKTESLRKTSGRINGRKDSEQRKTQRKMEAQKQKRFIFLYITVCPVSYQVKSFLYFTNTRIIISVFLLVYMK